MSERQAAPPRVLLGNLAPMVRLGMTRVLADEDVEVLAGDGTTVVADARRLRPDVVVLAQDGARGLCTRVRAAAPGAKIIFWPLDEDPMEVLDAGRDAPRRLMPPLPKALLGELGCGARTIERE